MPACPHYFEVMKIVSSAASPTITDSEEQRSVQRSHLALTLNSDSPSSPPLTQFAASPTKITKKKEQYKGHQSKFMQIKIGLIKLFSP